MTTQIVVSASKRSITTRNYNPEPVPQLTESDVENALQLLVDKTARNKGYRHGDACASYAFSTNPDWQIEAEAFIAWRDQLWISAFNLENPKTIEEVISGMPEMIWPIREN
jgi:hypothetical protein